MTSADTHAGFHYSLGHRLAEVEAPMTPEAQAPFTYTFHNFFHPFVAEMIQQLNWASVRGLLDPAFQAKLTRDVFAALYTVYDEDPNFVVHSQPETVDLSVGGPYANYNWELLFHVPLTIAVHLSKSQRFAEAARWFHFIFDPTSNDTSVEKPQRFWKFLKFRDKSPVKRIEELLIILAKPDKCCSDTEKELKRNILDGYAQSMSHPFEPHRVAASRPLAYQYHVVMKYLDNLIAWGDTLFLQDTVESINDATQKYILAANILGPRPQQLPARGVVRPKTFAQLKAAKLDAMGNAIVDLEGQFPFNQALPAPITSGSSGAAPLFGIGQSLYFCIPRNDKLLSYWTTVEDKLFKIRHCMNIQGTIRQLPQFEAPIDPGILVKAAASGIDVGSAVSGLNQPPGPVRALPLIQQALGLCAEVRGLGSALLTAMEKRDGEKLALLHSAHELAIQRMSKDAAFLRLKQAQETTESLLRGRKTTLERYRYYLHLLGREPNTELVPDTLAPDRRTLTQDNFDAEFAALVTQYDTTLPMQDYPQLVRPGAGSPSAQSGASGLGDLHLSTTEQAELAHLQSARDLRYNASVAEIMASVLTFIPEFGMDLAYWGLGADAKIFGGSKLSDAIKIAAEIQRTAAAWESDEAGLSSRTAGHERRVEEWTLAANLAARELMGVGRQLVSSLIAEQIARHEYETVQTRTAQAQEIDQFLREGKHAGQELYAWMQGEVSRLYYEYYRFAIDTARRAETTMKRELMRPEVNETDYVRFNYWDRGRHGLLAAEALLLDLKRMELAYHDSNKREDELTSHVSLRQLDGLALLKLKVTGSCEVTIPEWFYDLGTPGHYMRRLKTVAVSVPAVAGPYTSVNCTLTLLRSQVRTRPQPGANDAEYARAPDSDDRFVDYLGASESVVTSSAVNDSGMFETSLHDDRPLPFEGRGAVGTWRLELPQDFRTFNYDTISDVILHVRYTARLGGAPLARQATTEVRRQLSQASKQGMALLFALRHDFPSQWSEFLAGRDPLTLTVSRDHFPYLVQSRNLRIDALMLYGSGAGQLAGPKPLEVTQAMNDDLNDETGSFQLPIALNEILTREAKDVYLIIRYSLANGALRHETW